MSANSTNHAIAASLAFSKTSTTVSTASTAAACKPPTATTEQAPHTPSAPPPKTPTAPAAPKPAARHGQIVPPATPETPSPIGGGSTEFGTMNIAKARAPNAETASIAATSMPGGNVLQPSPMAPSAGLKDTPADPVPPTTIVSLQDSTAIEGEGVPSKAAAKLDDKMELTRIAAMSRDLYMAKGDEVRARTDWYKDGRGDVLVLKDDANAAREALAAHAADPEACEAPTAPARVSLGVIAMVEDDRCFLRSDGHFKGENIGTTWQKSFSQTTLSCALGPPPAEFPRLVTDYHAALATLRSVLPKGVNQQSGHVYQQIASPHFRGRHAAFAAKPANDDDTDGTDDGLLPGEFTIDQWPTYSEVARQALLNIQESHVARPLPAFDVHGKLIAPSRYVHELRGATVLAYLSIVTYKIGEKRANGTEAVKTTVCLDIDYMRVLIAPAQQVGGSRKWAAIWSRWVTIVARVTLLPRCLPFMGAMWPGNMSDTTPKRRRPESPGPAEHPEKKHQRVDGDRSEEPTTSATHSTGDADSEVVMLRVGTDAVSAAVGGGDIAAGTEGQDDGKHDAASTTEDVDDIECQPWASMENRRRLKKFLDLDSPQEEPWFSVAMVVMQSSWSWECRTWTQAIFTVNGMPARLFATGPIETMCFRSSLVGPASRGHVTIKLLRERDRVAMAGVSDRGRWTAEGKSMPRSPPFPRVTAVAGADVFANVFDASEQYGADRMEALHPGELQVGDIVTVEFIVVRIDMPGGYKMSYHALTIARLVAAPKKSYEDEDYVLRGPPNTGVWLMAGLEVHESRALFKESFALPLAAADHGTSRYLLGNIYMFNDVGQECSPRVTWNVATFATKPGGPVRIPRPVTVERDGACIQLPSDALMEPIFCTFERFGDVMLAPRLLVVIQFYERAAVGPGGMRQIAVQVDMKALWPPEVASSSERVSLPIHGAVASECDSDASDDDEEQKELLRNGIPIDTDEEGDIDESEPSAA
ncbi:hypothetical protein OH76DRAFT_1422333 [Lentinus brumalis]|uniref:Uncharacterized protein n=1 Tax=Lentinus brumalis TaxID=2498619 RepID=A0A371CR59_9APHY|nr:hypothetical protein OH76DRAFT_1422333 [Polyporus brumalis]